MQKIVALPAALLSLSLLVRTGLSFLHSPLEISPEEKLTCENGDRRGVLELFHTSDVIATGKVLEVQEGLLGTKTAKVHYYYAYKRDAKLRIPGLWCLVVNNIFNISSATLLKGPGLFFMVREPDDSLALQCYSTRVGDNTFRLLDYAEAIRLAHNFKFKTSITNVPCSPKQTQRCSEHAFCSIFNTLPGEEIRCVCLTGYYGNGTHCTPVNNTDKSSVITECAECRFGALCETSGDKLVGCVCPLEGCPNRRFLLAVCGTDGKTYRSLQALQRASCLQQHLILALYYGPCRNAFPACGGVTEPLIVGGNLVSCTIDNDCPAEHYCHHTHLFSICCHVTLSQDVPSSYKGTISTTSVATQSSVFTEFGGVTLSHSIGISITPTMTPYLSDTSGSGQYTDSSGSGPYSDLSGSDQHPDFNGTDQSSDLSESGQYQDSSETGQFPDSNSDECAKCRFGAACERSNRGSISCICPSIDMADGHVSSPVCGTNNKTYPSIVHLERDTCLKQELILPLYIGQCEDMLLPCAGLTSPLAIDDTLVHCTKSQSCPVQHYCHQTHLYSVCCPVIMPQQSLAPSPTKTATNLAFQSPDSNVSGQHMDTSGSGQYLDMTGSDQDSRFSGSGHYDNE